MIMKMIIFSTNSENDDYNSNINMMMIVKLITATIVKASSSSALLTDCPQP